MTTAIRSALVIALLSAFSFLAACIDDSNASASGPTQAEFDDLEARVAELEAALSALTDAGSSKPFNRIYAESGSGDGAQKAAPLTDLGDPVDCQDEGVNLRSCRTISPAGFLADIPLNVNPTVPQPMIDVFYQQAACQGQAYAAVNHSDFVTEGHDGIYYMEEGRGSIGTIIVASYHNTDGNCIEATPGPYEMQMAYELTDNDPAVSGWENSYPSEATFGATN